MATTTGDVLAETSEGEETSDKQKTRSTRRAGRVDMCVLLAGDVRILDVARLSCNRRRVSGGATASEPWIP